MTGKLSERRARRQRGSALVETALTLLSVLTVLFGTIELGRVVTFYTTLANAARAATRYAVVHGIDRTGSGSTGPSGPADSSQVLAVVTGYTTAAGIKTASLTVTISYPQGNTIGSPVTVNLTYPYTPIVGLIPLTVTLHSISKGFICY